MDQTDYIVEEFGSELVLVAEMVGLAPTQKWGGRKLVDIIRVRLQENGIPDAPDDEYRAALLDDFLYVDGWIDEDGVVQEGGGGGHLELAALLGSNEDYPDCFGYADDKDPACSRCVLYTHCAEERVACLPPCYGVLYDGADEECGVCLEAYYCKLA